MKIKFKCWTGQEMLDVHTLDLYGDKISGFHHFDDIEGNGESCVRLDQDYGHTFLQYLGLISENKELDWKEGDIIGFNNDESVGVIMYDKKQARFGIHYFNHELGTICEIHYFTMQKGIIIGNIFEAKGLPNLKKMRNYFIVNINFKQS